MVIISSADIFIRCPKRCGKAAGKSMGGRFAALLSLQVAGNPGTAESTWQAASGRMESNGQKGAGSETPPDVAPERRRAAASIFLKKILIGL